MPPQNVLIVDDSNLVCDILADAFSGEGFQTRVAHDAIEALEMIETLRPELIIADIVMPGMDGWSFFEAVRARPDCAHVPFVFLTQERDLPSRLRGLRDGAQDYITKPFSVEEILARARLALDRRAGLRKGAGKGAGQGAASPLSGHASLVSVADLLQLLAMNGHTGALRLFGESTGRVFLQNGRIVNALEGRASGRKALFRLLSWEDVEFRFDPGESALDGIPAVIDDSAESVLVEGLLERDELQRLHERLPALDQVLVAIGGPGNGAGTQVGAGAGLDAGADAPLEVVELEPTPLEKSVLARAAATTPTFADLLDDLAESDAEVARAVETLLRRGALEAH